jgi:hypothetical protein
MSRRRTDRDKPRKCRTGFAEKSFCGRLDKPKRRLVSTVGCHRRVCSRRSKAYCSRSGFKLGFLRSCLLDGFRNSIENTLIGDHPRQTASFDGCCDLVPTMQWWPVTERICLSGTRQKSKSKITTD